MKRVLTSMIILSLIGVVAVAQGPRPGFGQGRMVDQLQLTDQQKPEFEKLRAEQIKKMIDQRAKIAAARVDLGMLLNADAPQRAAVEKKLKEIADLQTQSQLARFDHRTAVQKILTPEQQKIMKNFGPQARRMGARDWQDRPRGLRRPMPGSGMIEQGPPIDR